MNKKIYIASPYTIGDQALNVKRQLDCFDELLKLGFKPFAPLHTHFQHMAHPCSYEEWLEWDFVWLECCNALLRLPGESRGADLEIQHAKLHNIPIFNSINEIVSYFSNTN